MTDNENNFKDHIFYSGSLDRSFLLQELQELAKGPAQPVEQTVLFIGGEHHGEACMMDTRGELIVRRSQPLTYFHTSPFAPMPITHYRRRELGFLDNPFVFYADDCLNDEQAEFGLLSYLWDTAVKVGLGKTRGANVCPRCEGTGLRR